MREDLPEKGLCQVTFGRMQSEVPGWPDEASAAGSSRWWRLQSKDRFLPSSDFAPALLRPRCAGARREQSG